MDIEVRRDSLADVRVVASAPAELEEGQARLAVARFGLSANNVTYAVFGEALRYWEFFPASRQAGEDGAWGRVPVWGFAEVVASRSPDAEPGERLFGYLPMSDQLVITPGRRDGRTVSDLSPHRRGLPGAYNSFQRCGADPVYRPERERAQMLLYPLFFTAFVIDDFLADHGDFGASQVVISSASSKTAAGTAFLLSRRGLSVVGLTSPAHRNFVDGLGVYAATVEYGSEARLDPVASVFIDVAGDAAVRAGVHGRLGDHLGHSMLVGGTHWDRPAAAVGPLPGPKPAFLFAPDQIAKRTGDWGAEQLAARVAAAWEQFAGWVDGWIRYEVVDGPDAIVGAYRALLAGGVDPTVGYCCTPGGGGEERS